MGRYFTSYRLLPRIAFTSSVINWFLMSSAWRINRIFMVLKIQGNLVPIYDSGALIKVVR